MGQICYKTHDRTGLVAGITSTQSDDDVVCITEQGKVLKATSSEVPVQGRSSSGVRVGPASMRSIPWRASPARHRKMNRKDRP